MEVTFIEIGMKVMYGENATEIISYPMIRNGERCVLVRGFGDWVPVSDLKLIRYPIGVIDPSKPI